MISFIFRSSKKQEMYLYLTDREGFDDLDDSLKSLFGMPEFVMMVNLGKRNKLARVDIERVKDELSNQGYFLQLPPQPHKLNARNDE